MFDLEALGQQTLRDVKRAKFFPVDTGTLRKNTIGNLIAWDTYRIWFNNIVCPYVEYLETGTKPHDIPHAFGYGSIYPDRNNPYSGEPPFGVSGRFSGKFHPGSTKHKGFIENKFVISVASYIAVELDGRLEVA